MTGKSLAAWLWVREWVRMNPGKTAAVVTPDGTFTIVFAPKEK